MKKITLMVALLVAAGCAEAQVIKNLNPEQSIVYLTDQKAADFEKAQKFLAEKGENITEADIDYATSLGYDEMYASYWDIVGEGCSWYCGDGGPIKIKASSRLANQGSNNYNEKNLHDLQYNTPWVEGVKGYGIGEWVEYTFKADNPRITTIHVVNGYCKSQTAWKNNSRVKALKVYVNGNPLAVLNLEDSRSDQAFEIAPLTDSKEWTMRFEILDVYKGDKYDDTVLSEIYFSGLDVHCFAAGTKVLMSDLSTKNIEDIREGDQVMSFDFGTNSQEPATVEQTAAVKHCNLVTYAFNDGSSITATDDHPFLTERGWASANPAKSAIYNGFQGIAQIQVGDKVVTNSGVLTLESTTVSPTPQMTYTIVRLSNGNAFYANGIAVGAEEVKEDIE